MSKLSIQQVEHIARLSRLGLTKEEVEKFSAELSDILNFVELLKEVDTKGVQPIAQITGLQNVASDDEISESYVSREELLQNVPQAHEGFIKVKPVFEEREVV